jgi:hypothetical protein
MICRTNRNANSVFGFNVFGAVCGAHIGALKEAVQISRALAPQTYYTRVIIEHPISTWLDRAF